MRVIRLDSAAVNLLPLVDPSGGADPVYSGTPYVITPSPDAAVLEFAVLGTSPDARAILRGPSGLVAELGPGDTVPLSVDPQTAGDWSLAGSIHNLDSIAANPSWVFWLWTEKEALFRASRQGPQRRQRAYGMIDLMGDIDGSAAEMPVTGPAFDLGGITELTAFLEATARSTAGYWGVKLQVTYDGGESASWFDVPTESIAAAVGTLDTPYEQRHAVTGPDAWIANWNVNARRGRFVLTTDVADAGDIIELHAMGRE